MSSVSTPGLESYWAFANARWDLMVTGETDDPILQKYRFTNCHRWCDRVSQYMLWHIPHRYTGIELIWRIALYKTFNKVATWEKLERAGLVNLPANPDEIGAYLNDIGDLMSQSAPNFSPAYRMCIGITTYGFKEKHRNWLRAAWSVAESYRELEAARTVKQLYDVLIEKPMFGRFLAMQFATDISYITGASEDGFVIAGPGSRRGIHMMHDDLRGRIVIGNGLDDMYAERIKLVWATQDKYFNGPRLELMDVQNIFCEYDKYSRIQWPHIQLVAKEKKRPKQIYAPSPRGRMRWPVDFKEPSRDRS